MSNILRKQNKMIDMTPPADAYDVTYGNTTVGDELDGLTANTISAATRVDISSYDDSTPYECTVDGYVELASNASGRQGLVRVNGADLLANVSGTQLISTLYVKKGMNISCTVSGGAVVFFYPLS